ncbi:hypothetical protein LOK49_LG10G01390 [Camellia lanceoleosa]|uniref:Uncharacterized protein n=1 Tax=Camellia lanceoleosa TaxID=1840588 RepID=A0ACC0G9Z5_9ERIC|nr:hypothetical protein LOK49_LG10G01390 [Camellia lanceoleosa]
MINAIVVVDIIARTALVPNAMPYRVALEHQRFRYFGFLDDLRKRLRPSWFFSLIRLSSSEEHFKEARLGIRESTQQQQHVAQNNASMELTNSVTGTDEEARSRQRILTFAVRRKRLLEKRSRQWKKLRQC